MPHKLRYPSAAFPRVAEKLVERMVLLEDLVRCVGVGLERIPAVSRLEVRVEQLGDASTDIRGLAHLTVTALIWARTSIPNSYWSRKLCPFSQSRTVSHL